MSHRPFIGSDVTREELNHHVDVIIRRAESVGVFRLSSSVLFCAARVDLEEGMRVRVLGLQKQPELNGTPAGIGGGAEGMELSQDHP